MSTMTHPPQTHVHRPRVNPWLMAVVVLAAALVGLGAWVIVDQTRSSSGVSPKSSTAGLASPTVVAMLRERLAALNGGDPKTISAFYTRHAVLDDRAAQPPLKTVGSQEIGKLLHFYVKTLGMQLESVGPIVQVGSGVAEATRVPGSTNDGFMLVYNLAANGKIAHQWVLPIE